LPIRLVRIAARCGLLAVLWLSIGVGSAPCRAQPADATTAQSLIDSAASEIRIDPDAGRRQLESALAMLVRTPDPDVAIRAHLLLADYYVDRDQTAAQGQINAANELLPLVARRSLEADVLNTRGRLLQIAGDNDQAARLFDQAAEIAESSHDEDLLADALMSRGSLRGLNGEYAQGLTDLRRAQALFEQHDLSQRALSALNNIAIIYYRMGDADEAVHIFQRTLEAQRNAGLKRDEIATQRNMGDAYQNLKQWSAARAAYSSALELSRQIDYPRGQSSALRGLANVATEQGDANSALGELEQAAQLQQQTPDLRLLAQIDLARGVALHKLNRQKLSLPLLSQAQTLFKQTGSQGELATTYNELAAVDADLGNWRDAFEYRSLSQTLFTRLLRTQIDQRFATLKVEFDTASREKENALLIRENTANQTALAQRLKASNLQTAVIVLVVLLLGVLTMLAVHQRRASLRLRLLAMTDELTGVPNRRAVITLLSQLLRRSAEPTSILIIDLDHFKSINDRHGHLVGDETLKQISADLRYAVTNPGFFGRLGGEEFAALLQNTTLEDASRIADMLRERVLLLDLSRWLGERRVTISIGIATSLPGRDSISSMLRRADSALYAAKDAGRNCVRSKSSDELEHQITPRVA